MTPTPHRLRTRTPDTREADAAPRPAAPRLAGGDPYASVTRSERGVRRYAIVIRDGLMAYGPSHGSGCGVHGWTRFTRASADRKAARELARYQARHAS